MVNQQVTESELGWLAGIIDGEGYLGITHQNKKRNKHSVKPEIQIVNTDIMLVDRVIDILQRLGISPYIRTRKYKTSKWNDAWNITVGKFTAIVILLAATLQYLVGIKREKAKIMLDFCTARLTKGRKPYDEQDLSLIKKFREVGTSETTREAPKWVKI